jgi:fatty-acyl-CoA synthase
MMPVRFAEAAAGAYGYPLLIGHLLHAPLACAAKQEIVYRDRMRYTYADLADRIGRLARALSRLGIDSGDTVAVMDWDSHRYLECYFAIPMMGAVLQTVNVRLSPEQILYTINHAGARLLLIHSDFLPLYEALRERLTSVETAVLLGDSSAAEPTPKSFAGEYEALLARADGPFEFTDFDENAVATTFYTTGTTGNPKGVSFSHRQVVLHTLATLGAFASAGDRQSFRAQDVYMPLTPMFHVHAWGLPYVATTLGVKQVYPGRYEPSAILGLRERERVTYSHCVPTILQMLLDAPEAARTDLRGWKITIGGSALPAGLAQRALDHGLEVFAAYGMSETCPVLTVSRLAPGDEQSPATHPSSLRKAGTPIPLVQLRVVDEDMHDVPHDGQTSGEIVVRAPWLTMAYRDDSEASAVLWRQGYLHTRDVGAMGPDGSLEVRDRLKDIIKSGGEWICSLQLEDLISQHPGVAQVAVIGIPDETWGERPLALVVPRPDWRARLSGHQIKDHLQRLSQDGVIARYAIPAHVEIVDELERTSVGKLDKKSIRERFRHA